MNSFLFKYIFIRNKIKLITYNKSKKIIYNEQL